MQEAVKHLQAHYRHVRLLSVEPHVGDFWHGIIAEPRPQTQHFLFTGPASERASKLYKTVQNRGARLDLRLLEHNFRNQTLYGDGSDRHGIYRWFCLYHRARRLYGKLFAELKASEKLISLLRFFFGWCLRFGNFPGARCGGFFRNILRRDCRPYSPRRIVEHSGIAVEIETEQSFRSGNGPFRPAYYFPGKVDTVPPHWHGKMDFVNALNVSDDRSESGSFISLSESTLTTTPRQQRLWGHLCRPAHNLQEYLRTSGQNPGFNAGGFADNRRVQYLASARFSLT